jgi:HTH-type transcriptional regulator / antitoxin HigA
MTSTQQFRPDWVSPPGDSISDILKTKNKSIHDFSEELKFTHDHTKRILEGSADITLDIAHELARVLGSSAKFWMNREIQYRQDLARNLSCHESDDWLDELPVRDMIKFGWINSARTSAEKVKECLRFFNVSDVACYVQ